MSSAEVTRTLAAFAVGCRFEDLPHEVIRQTLRGFLQWLGDACSGSRDPMVSLVLEAVHEVGAAPQASVIGRGTRVDLASAAFLNCLASRRSSHDPKPQALVAGAALAWSQHGPPVRGHDFIGALAAGLEIQSRLNEVLLTAPAKTHPGFALMGLTGPIAAAATVGRLMKLDEAHMTWAIGLGASQACGFLCAGDAAPAAFSCAQAARSGVNAALLAAKGFTNLDTALEAPAGFFEVYSSGADVALAVDGLGRRYAIARDSHAQSWPDDTLDAGFDAQAAKVYAAGVSAQLRRACHRMAELKDVGRELASLL